MAGSRQRQTCFADYLSLLKLFSDSDTEALIVGGQAVNLWAEMFEEEEPELRQYRPFTSADLDLHRLNVSAQKLLRNQAGDVEVEREPLGKAFTIVSHTFLIEGKEGQVLPVHNLKMVAGLRSSELRKAAVVVEYAGLRAVVLNPIACLKAKLHNASSIDQQDRQDLKHARMLILCVRAFLRRLIHEASVSGRYRPALNALKELLNCTSRRSIIKTSRAHGLDLTGAVPLSDLAGSPHPKFASFVRHRLPQWQHLLNSSG